MNYLLVKCITSIMERTNLASFYVIDANFLYKRAFSISTACD